MKTFHVYMLQCSDDSIYVGVTSDLNGRLLKHQSRFYPNSHTSTRLPVKLIWSEARSYWETAFDREKQLKRWSKEKKLSLANGELQNLKKRAKKVFK